MNENKFDYYYVTIDGHIGGLRGCFSEHKYETYSKALEMFKILVGGYILINNTNVTLSIIGTNNYTDMVVLNWVRIDNK